MAIIAILPFKLFILFIFICPDSCRAQLLYIIKIIKFVLMLYVYFVSACLFRHCTSARLHTTRQRLCEGGAYTTVSAGYKLSFTHYFFCGVTAPLSQNRSLGAGSVGSVVIIRCFFVFLRSSFRNYSSYAMPFQAVLNFWSVAYHVGILHFIVVNLHLTFNFKNFLIIIQ